MTDAEFRSASVKYGKNAEKQLLLNAKFGMLSGVARAPLPAGDSKTTAAPERGQYPFAENTYRSIAQKNRFVYIFFPRVLFQS